MTKNKDSKYSPAFLAWLHNLQVALGEEVEIADAWEVYDDGASVRDAVTVFRNEY